MSIAERKQRQKEEVRASILQAAWQLIEEDGYQALSMRKIADAIHYSAPVIYSHFENKHALLIEFSREGYRLMVEQVQAAKEHYEGDSPKQLEAMALAYWSFAFDHSAHYQLMFTLSVGIPSCETAAQVPEIRAFGETVIPVIRAVIAASKKPDADHFLKWHTYFSILHGLISINMSGASDMPRDLSKCILQDAIAGFILALKG